jgi:hypothetical protein
MSAVTDGITLINILKRGGSANNPQLLRIAARFQVYAGTEFIAADPENPTNEELADNLLFLFRRFGQSVLRGQAEAAERATQIDDVTAAGDAAVADL